MDDTELFVAWDTGYASVFCGILSVGVVVSSNVVVGTAADASDASVLSLVLLSASDYFSPRSILKPSIAIAIQTTSNEMIEAINATDSIVSLTSLV